MPIRILVTSRTFDKDYDKITKQLYFNNNHVKEILELGRSRLEVKIKTLMLIDSLDMSDANRSLILENCKAVDEDQVVITHGTDTMTETARVVAKEKLNKTIVFTGAMIPYKFGSSDGLFNFGGALALAQTLPYGVYIVMNGRCFEWDRVKKNKKTGVFEDISQ